jgi:perosamine synthetase
MIAANMRGSEIITSPMSFVASANSIIHAGATPRFADISLRNYTIDPAKVRASLTNKTKALLPVHLYGFPADMRELREIASEQGLLLIEDACQAHGATYDGKKAGSLGDIGCFSFYPSKNMTVGGDGGMLVTHDKEIAESTRSLRDCGRVKGKKYLHDLVGFTERLNTVQAAIGRVQLRRLDKWNEDRRRIASRYDRSFRDLKNVTTPTAPDSSRVPVYHLYVLRCSRRDELRTWLENFGVETGVHYEEPIHMQPVYRELFGYRGGEFPVSEGLCRETLSLPIYVGISDEEVDYVTQSTQEFYERNSTALS